MQLRTIESEADLMTLAAAMFGTTESWEWNIENNTAHGAGHHIAAFECGKLIGYADCELDGSLLQSWSARPGVAEYLEDGLLRRHGLSKKVLPQNI